VNAFGTDRLVLGVTIQLILIMSTARIFGWVFRRIGQPQVCGEIAAGLILGPSLFGALWPGLMHRVFDPAYGQILTALSQIGLILLMFLIGLDFDFGHLKAQGRTAAAISFAGIAAPFALGLLIAGPVHAMAGGGVNRVGFALFMAVALSITAIPTLGRIMMEFNLNRTRIGSLTIIAAGTDDVVGWTLLAVVSGYVRSGLAPVHIAVMLGEIICFGLVMIVIVRPWIQRYVRWELARNQGGISLGGLAITLVTLFLSADITNFIGISPVFGAFLLGAILSSEREFRAAVFARLHDLVMVFFLPIFFTYTGLRTDVGSMTSGLLWVLCGLIILVAFLGKCGGSMVAALLAGVSRSDAFSIGVMMNTRGLMELIVVNIGYELGVIPKSVFFMLVVMAVTTTFMAAPMLRRTLRGVSEDLDPGRDTVRLPEQASVS